jgi:hypothetical protein
MVAWKIVTIQAVDVLITHLIAWRCRVQSLRPVAMQRRSNRN